MRNTIAATRPPQPDRSQPVNHRARERTATLGDVSQIAHWLPDALNLNGPAVLLIDERETSRPPDGIVATIANVVDASILPSANTSGWVRLTDLAGASLTSADMRADAASTPEILMVSRPHERSGAAHAADALFHPNTRLRAAALPQDGSVELTAWAAPTWVIVIQSPQTSIACVTQSAVLAELLALGAYRLTEKSHSIEAVSPWEEPTVQRLFELEIESGGHRTSLQIDASLARERAWVDRLAETIGAEVSAE
ncbi:MAG: hypothetical protein M9890_06275 [Thermomicrobiales bacterium]|nr:hypothetical protein [Thermomicrobiales bacterium]